MSSPPLRVFLTPEEDRTLFELRKASDVPQRTKDRAAVLRLNAHGWKVRKIAAHFNWAESTVRQTIHRWRTQGLAGLWDTPRPGRQRRWQDADLAYLDECLQQEQRTYSSRQLSQKLSQERQVNLSPAQLRRVLKKKELMWKRTCPSHRDKQHPQDKQVKQGDLEILELAYAAGEICLKYLDESGFCMWSAASYTWARRGQQKRLEQTQRRGRRVSILGLMQPQVSFEYGLAVGSFTSESYIRLMDWEAKQAAWRLAQTGQITVVAQDNSSIHTSQPVRARIPEWEFLGLYFFFLPKYCSEMNLIEGEWHQIKAHEMAGRMFEDEYDLALAVIEGVEARGERGGYSTQRFKFNSG